MLKFAVSQTIKLQIATMKALFKLCIAILKAVLTTTMFAATAFGGLAAFLAVGPMHTPAWMMPAWNMLNNVDPVRLVDALGGETSPLWEVRDSSLIVSRWMAQFLPVADLLATAAGVAKEHWLRTEVELSMQHVHTLVKADPKLAQAICCAWIVATVCTIFLVFQTLIGMGKLFGRCVRCVIRAMCPAHTTTIKAAETVLPDGAGATPKLGLAESTPALTVNTRSNIIAETTMTSEKKGGRRRLESPVAKITKVGKEDVPPSMASPLRRKHSELSELGQQGIVTRRLHGITR